MSDERLRLLIVELRAREERKALDGLEPDEVQRIRAQAAEQAKTS